MEMWQVRRDEALAIFTSIDTEVNRIVDELDINDDCKKQLLLDYKEKVTIEEQVSKKRWEKARKNLEDMPNWGKKHVSQVDNRTYHSYAKATSSSIPKDQSTSKQEGWSIVNRNRRRNNQQFPPYVPIATPLFYDYSMPPPPHVYTNSYKYRPNSNFINRPLTRESNSYFHNAKKSHRWKSQEIP
ncbi:MAG: hypothetical protein HRT42_13395 [Campylobacteraceae bacterium]|nr:hypothetical protein [Campylobacteraceae bacterium]